LNEKKQLALGNIIRKQWIWHGHLLICGLRSICRWASETNLKKNVQFDNARKECNLMLRLSSEKVVLLGVIKINVHCNLTHRNSSHGKIV